MMSTPVMKDDYDTPSNASISVMAPSDMPGGYEFFADAGNGSSYKVRVPDSGVKAGERFDAIIIQQATGNSGGGYGHSVPTGHWRDGLCDCFTLGACHAVCCLGCWCRLCLLGQVLTRNKLGWIGSPNNTAQVNPCSYQFWFGMMVVSLVLGFLGNTIQVSLGKWEQGPTTYDAEGIAQPGSVAYTGPGWATTLANLCSIITLILSILACVTTCKAREYLRQKYNIEPEMCGSCEDCCCAYWCGPCTICQMARHTADYRNHKAECCSPTGLIAGAPEIV